MIKTSNNQKEKVKILIAEEKIREGCGIIEHATTMIAQKHKKKQIWASLNNENETTIKEL